MPSSMENIQWKLSFHSGSIPIRLIFDWGLSVLEDDLHFAIFLFTSAHEVDRGHVQAC